MLTEAGVVIPAEPDILLKIMKRSQQLSQRMKFALFDDVLPTVKTLKQQNLILGLLTNLDAEMKPICRELGLEPLLVWLMRCGTVRVSAMAPLIVGVVTLPFEVETARMAAAKKGLNGFNPSHSIWSSRTWGCRNYQDGKWERKKVIEWPKTRTACWDSSIDDVRRMCYNELAIVM
jgi:hypothetical protein